MYICVEHPDQEEFVLACSDEFSEVGVLVDMRGYATNRWGDGIAGVPEDVRELVMMHDCEPLCPQCWGTTEWKESRDNE